MHARRAIRLILLALAALTLAAGCGSDDADDAEDAPTATPVALDAQELLEDGAAALDEIDAVRFNLEIEGETYVDDGESIRLVGARGDLVRPGSVDVQFQAELLGTRTVSIRMITVDDQSWTTNLVSGAWEPSPDEFGYDPAVLFDPDTGLSAIATQLDNPTYDGEETLGGRETHRVIGTATNEVMSPLTSGTIDGDVITITIWLDTESLDILRLRVQEPDDAAKDEPATWTMTLTGHGEDLTVEPPDLGG